MSATESTDLLERRMLGRLAGRFAARAQTRAPIGLQQIASWQSLVDLCLELDDQLNFSELEPPETVALHKAVLHLGIGTGEWLRHQVRSGDTDFPTAAKEIKILDASLALLRTCFDSRHADIPQDEIERIRQQIFNGPS